MTWGSQELPVGFEVLIEGLVGVGDGPGGCIPLHHHRSAVLLRGKAGFIVGGLGLSAGLRGWARQLPCFLDNHALVLVSSQVSLLEKSLACGVSVLLSWLFRKKLAKVLGFRNSCVEEVLSPGFVGSQLLFEGLLLAAELHSLVEPLDVDVLEDLVVLLRVLVHDQLLLGVHSLQSGVVASHALGPLEQLDLKLRFLQLGLLDLEGAHLLGVEDSLVFEFVGSNLSEHGLSLDLIGGQLDLVVNLVRIINFAGSHFLVVQNDFGELEVRLLLLGSPGSSDLLLELFLGEGLLLHLLDERLLQLLLQEGRQVLVGRRHFDELGFERLHFGLFVINLIIKVGRSV